MRLVTAYFDAFKSLLNIQLDMETSCIGLVGINESGKSNVLGALSKLSVDNPLKSSDSPKIKRCDPRLRFRFKLEESEIVEITSQLKLWAQERSVPTSVLDIQVDHITYHVTYNRAEGEEQRYFSIDNALLPTGLLVRLNETLTSQFPIKLEGKAVDLENCLFLSERDISDNESLRKEAAELRLIQEDIRRLKAEIDSIESDRAEDESSESDGSLADESTTEIAAEDEEVEDLEEPEDDEDDWLTDSEIDRLLEEKMGALQLLQEKQDALTHQVMGVDVVGRCSDFEVELEFIEASLAHIDEECETTAAAIAELSTEPATDQNKKQLLGAQKSLASLKSKQKADRLRALTLRRYIASLEEPLRNKFSDDISVLARHLGHAVRKSLAGYLPRVVFWRYSEDFLLADETLFEEMLGAQDPEQISRPLFNLFRIGLGVQTIGQLHSIIKEVQSDPSERSRNQVAMNHEVSEYLSSVWPDYNQRISVFLEQERVRVQFVDPSSHSASYFTMQERSQGCQTFISFLLTIGAEAKHGVITNTVLLLDEPETHLHPSGVKHMLRELITASENENLVVFATHSVFMIDRENWARHIIVKKTSERTELQPSQLKRVGYFIQEEVLYDALSVSTTDDFALRKQLNFVCEGDGDVAMLECFYEHALREGTRPVKLKDTAFLHGGGCNRIKDYFSRKPIQLGTTWVFILDNDKPALELKAFISKKYKDFLDRYIFVCHYEKAGLKPNEVEFEDLLSTEFLQMVVDEVFGSGDGVDTRRPTIIDGKRSFASCLQDLLAASSDTSELKGVFKEKLNRHLAEELKKISKDEQFDTFAPDYSKWVQGVIEKLRAQ